MPKPLLSSTLNNEFSIKIQNKSDNSLMKVIRGATKFVDSRK